MGEFNLDPVLWLENGIGESDNWFSLVHYDCWNSIWEAVFLNGKTFFHAIWCKCDRVEQ